ncbi:hypothetical protein FM106_16740 [Brachybacterium faecium]|nr:hypothetical protein FM106_16740 [Brachybacterium faecium]
MTACDNRITVFSGKASVQFRINFTLFNKRAKTTQSLENKFACEVFTNDRLNTLSFYCSKSRAKIKNMQ